MKLIITRIIFIPRVMASCYVQTSRRINYTWFIEVALQANDDGEKTSKLTYLGVEEDQ